MAKIDSATQHEVMLKTPMPKLLFKMAIPTVIMQMITVIYNTADTFFVAKIGTTSVAAVGVVFSLMSLIQALGCGIGMGANALISVHLGQKKDEDARKFANSAFVAAFIVGIIILIVGLCVLEPLMRLMGATETVLPEAVEYARYILIGAPFMCVEFVLNSILRSEGEAILSASGLAVGGILNAILDPVFIFVCDMGVGGAALATMIGEIVGFGIYLGIFLGGKSILQINPKYASRNIIDYLKIIKTGIPTVFRQSMGSLSSALLNNQAALFGDFAIAGISIANKVYMLVRNLVIGIGQGYQPIAGYNYGAGNKKRVKKAFGLSCLVGTAICLVCAVLIYAFGGQIVAWFRDDANVIEVGVKSLHFLCIAMPLLAYSTYVNQTYQCLGYSLCATILACCRQGIFFVPLLFLLTHFFGITGIQSTQASADVLTFLVSIPFQVVFFKKFLATKETSLIKTTCEK